MSRSLPRRYVVGFLACMIAVGAGGVVAGTKIDRNSEAIYKSCALMSNLVTSTQDPRVRKPSQLLIQAILASMPPDKQAEYFDAVAESPPLRAPDCKQAAQEPESIALTPTPTPTVIRRDMPSLWESQRRPR